MKPFILSAIFSIICSVIMSCKSPSGDDQSTLRDVGLINTLAAKNLALYQEGNQIFLKTCKSISAAPVTRDCASDAAPKSMPEDEYFNKLPFDVAPYPPNEESLATVTNFLQTATVAAQSGNQSAAASVQKLEVIQKNLKIIRSVRLSLKEKQNSLTYFEYQDEFQKLLTPFGVTAIKQPNNSQPPATSSVNNSGMTPKQCFSILRKEMSRNWYDESLWPACLGGGDLSCVVNQFRQNPDYYPEDLPEPCGGIYNMRNQPDFDVSDMPKKPEIQTPTRPTTPPPPVVTSPQRPNSNSGAAPCRGAKVRCSVNWECCSNSCGMDGLCQAGSGGCVAPKGFCGVNWQCCSQFCDDLTGLCH